MSIFKRDVVEYVCGICGTTKRDNKYGFCKNGHDYWISADNLINPDYVEYIASAKIPLNKIKHILGV